MSRLRIRLSWVASALMLTGLLLPITMASAQNAANKPFPLMVGDPAPQLTVSKWVKGEALKNGFEKGRTYVVEFWATWCGPCKKSIPHLTELQKKYRDRLTIIGISVWEPRPAEVAPFVARMGDKMDYTIAQDEVEPAPTTDEAAISRWAVEHGKMSAGWMVASGWSESGIPTTFIVNGEGQVAWIGNPTELDAPLEKVISGKWEVKKFMAGYYKRMAVEAQKKPLQKEFMQARRSKDWNAAIAKSEEIMRLDPVGSAYLAGFKFETLLTRLNDPDRAYKYAREAMNSTARNDADALGQIAYVIMQQGEKAGQAELDLGLRAAERADSLAKGTQSYIVETLARLYFLKKDMGQAVKHQTRVVSMSEEAEAKIAAEKTLAEYKKAANP